MRVFCLAELRPDKNPLDPVVRFCYDKQGELCPWMKGNEAGGRVPAGLVSWLSDAMIHQ